MFVLQLKLRLFVDQVEVQLRRPPERGVRPRDEGFVGEVSRSRNGDDHHEDREVSALSQILDLHKKEMVNCNSFCKAQKRVFQCDFLLSKKKNANIHW